jgi:hypothetical protein
VNGQTGPVVNHHFYQIAAKQAATHSDIVGRLIEQAVLGELKSLGSGGRDIWHPKDFSEALQVIEQVGPERKERIAQIRKSMESYRQKGRLHDFHDF